MPGDPDEYLMQKAIERQDPMRTLDALERIEWRLMYGQFGLPTGAYAIGITIIALLGLIVWRLWA